MSIFHYNQKRIHYTEQGTGEPLLLLHGNAASSNMFYGVAPKFATDYRVILIDFLGHGASDRLAAFSADMWYYEAEQVIAFLREKKLERVNLIGTSGGANVAINVALEAPELVNKVIADSLEGESLADEVVAYIREERSQNKKNKEASQFYYYMHGDDWESVVDNDTRALIAHGQQIKRFFHKALTDLETEILLVGSKEDEFMAAVSSSDLEETYKKLFKKIKHGEIHLFQTGGHPSLMTNLDQFVALSNDFLRR